MRLTRFGRRDARFFGDTARITGGASGIGLGEDKARGALALELTPDLVASRIYRDA